MYTDKIIKCKECGGEFMFSAGEQEFYAEKGFGTPSRCKECRVKIKQAKRREVVLYEIVCSKCGEVVSVPFEPRHDRPVFCGECYKEQKA